MSEELKPCPFCGPGQSVVSLWYDDASKAQRVGCGRCGVSTGIRPRSEERTAANAIAAWNRRASPRVEDVRREALEEAAEICADMAKERHEVYANANRPDISNRAYAAYDAYLNAVTAIRSLSLLVE